MYGIVLCGPTGVGKTDISIRLAEKINAEIISTDSMQVYKHMNIGTAKIIENETKGIKHHMLDIVEPNYKFTVGEYQKRADEILNKLEESNKNVILVGGTGLYIDSVIRGLSILPKSDTRIRENLENKTKKELFDELEKLDKEASETIHINNKIRLIRALEVCKITGKKFSELKNKNVKNNNYKFYKFGLTRDREILYERINKRVEIMFDNGLLEEAKYLYENYKEGLDSIQAIGYQELFEYFDGKIQLEEAKELIKQNSRKYAKRQFTWFNKDQEMKWFDLDKENIEKIINEMMKIINEKECS